jgi:hypothetical protein
MAISAVQPARSEIEAGKALSMTARTFTGWDVWRANLDPGPAQLTSCKIANGQAMRRHAANTRRGRRDRRRTVTGLTLTQLVAVLGPKIQTVDPLEIGNPLERRRLEGHLVVQGMERDAFEKIAEREVEVFGQSLEHLEQPFFETDAGLNALDDAMRFCGFGLGHGHGLVSDAITWSMAQLAAGFSFMYIGI